MERDMIERMHIDLISSPRVSLRNFRMARHADYFNPSIWVPYRLLGLISKLQTANSLQLEFHVRWV